MSDTSQPESPQRPTPLRGRRLSPDGTHFPWGVIDETHVIGPYCVVEFRRDASRMDRPESWAQHNETQFHTYVRRDTIDGWKWDDTHHTWHSLDAALAHAIAYRAEGANGRAHSYFIKMIGGEC